MNIEALNENEIFLPSYKYIDDKEHAACNFNYPGLDRDILILPFDNRLEKVTERVLQPDAKRPWMRYGPNWLKRPAIKNAQRNEPRTKYGVIG